MSKKEMENLDEQVLQVANSSGEGKNAEAAQEAVREEQRRAKELHAMKLEEMKRAEKKAMEAYKMKRLLAMLAKVVACLLAAGVFLALLLEPKFWVPVIGCVGIITFIVVGAICIDRYVHIMKGWR